jgi:putative acetyltransferase
MLDQLVVLAQENDLPLLRLERGVFQQAAIQRYENFGFRRIGPFGPYHAEPTSLFYELFNP